PAWFGSASMLCGASVSRHGISASPHQSTLRNSPVARANPSNNGLSCGRARRSASAVAASSHESTVIAPARPHARGDRSSDSWSFNGDRDAVAERNNRSPQLRMRSEPLVVLSDRTCVLDAELRLAHECWNDLAVPQNVVGDEEATGFQQRNET